MTTFLKELEKYAEVEQLYNEKHPQAQPLGNFYQYFGLSEMLKILEESEGREIEFYVEKTTNQCLYTFK